MQPLEEFLEEVEEAGVPESTIRAAFARLRAQLPPALVGIFDRIDIGLSEAQDAAELILGDAHSRAAYLGRRLAGSDEPYGEYDEQFGKLVAEQEAQWFEALHADVSSGRYTNDDGTLDSDLLESRATNYEERLRGTANEAWVNTLADDKQLIEWVLGEEDANNCSVCPYLAEDGPYEANALPTYPGANETPCMFNCRCELRSEDGTTGF